MHVLESYLIVLGGGMAHLLLEWAAWSGEYRKFYRFRAGRNTWELPSRAVLGRRKSRDSLEPKVRRGTPALAGLPTSLASPLASSQPTHRPSCWAQLVVAEYQLPGRDLYGVKWGIYFMKRGSLTNHCCAQYHCKRHVVLVGCWNEWQETVLTQQAFPLAQLLNPAHFILARETCNGAYVSQGPSLLTGLPPDRKHRQRHTWERVTAPAVTTQQNKSRPECY